MYVCVHAECTLIWAILNKKNPNILTLLFYTNIILWKIYGKYYIMEKWFNEDSLNKPYLIF